MITHLLIIIVSATSLLGLTTVSSHATTYLLHTTPDHNEKDDLIQGMIGVMKFEHDMFSLTTADGHTYEGDMPSLPYLGGMAQFSYINTNVINAGIEAGVLFGFVNYSTTVVVNGGASVYFQNQFLLTDGMLGGYVDGVLADRFRVYVAGGPMIMYGRLQLDNQDNVSTQPAYVNQTVTGFDIGGYARAGVELKMGHAAYVGVQAGYIRADLHFGNDVGEIDMSSYQYMLTATQAY